ncbi:hypothetical protein GLAREA_00295 [Glarea lozoyensis ATCC 20868]|uniref:Uncharacterized protein n=1 Tax=Glarea lozoyensis (strain ATCC 20868 / MF5171) TaxID=1116229 RepID=S3CRP1_GLAL2|nr:uncharacterized protein GLAREA_00295 [Glarea lozoyensis ATCC 20868]EPE29137.1 hypothetical protein GLAREA_00295 [Glarea lozoyensis ATCC 20868]
MSSDATSNDTSNSSLCQEREASSSATGVADSSPPRKLNITPSLSQISPTRNRSSSEHTTHVKSSDDATNNLKDLQRSRKGVASDGGDVDKNPSNKAPIARSSQLDVIQQNNNELRQRALDTSTSLAHVSLPLVPLTGYDEMFGYLGSFSEVNPSTIPYYSTCLAASRPLSHPTTGFCPRARSHPRTSRSECVYSKASSCWSSGLAMPSLPAVNAYKRKSLPEGLQQKRETQHQHISSPAPIFDVSLPGTSLNEMTDSGDLSFTKVLRRFREFEPLIEEWARQYPSKRTNIGDPPHRSQHNIAHNAVNRTHIGLESGDVFPGRVSGIAYDTINLHYLPWGSSGRNLAGSASSSSDKQRHQSSNHTLIDGKACLTSWPPHRQPHAPLCGSHFEMRETTATRISAATTSNNMSSRAPQSSAIHRTAELSSSLPALATPVGNRLSSPQRLSNVPRAPEATASSHVTFLRRKRGLGSSSLATTPPIEDVESLRASAMRSDNGSSRLQQSTINRTTEVTTSRPSLSARDGNETSRAQQPNLPRAFLGGGGPEFDEFAIFSLLVDHLQRHPGMGP